MTRTSLSHPLRIATLEIGSRGGKIGITFPPGKTQPNAMTGSWIRDLDLDLKAIRDWGANHLISLLEPWEFEELKIQDLPKRTEALGIRWHGLHITDGAAPDERFFLDIWLKLGPDLVMELAAGSRAVVHCKGGLGRAGTVAAMLLLENATTTSFEEAINLVRAVRPGAIETIEQVKFLNGWAESIV